jgi:hypothetical protein
MTFTFEPYVEFCRRRAAFFRKVAIGIALFGSALFWANYIVDLTRGWPFIRRFSTTGQEQACSAVSFTETRQTVRQAA